MICPCHTCGLAWLSRAIRGASPAAIGPCSHVRWRTQGEPMRALFKRLGIAAAVAAISAGFATAQPVEVVVQYSQPQIFDKVFELLKADFEAQNPGIRIKFRGPHKDYGAGLQALLREAVVNDMPHVNYVGLSHVPVVADRGIAVDLAKLMTADGSTFEQNGWTESLQSLGRAGGKQIALPFAVSMSLVYFNA